MKRLLVFILALVIAIPAGLTAFAADDEARAIPYWAADTTEANPRLMLQKNQLVLGMEGDIVLLPDTMLMPGKTYSYPIYRVDEDYTSVAPNAVKMTLVTDTMLNGAELRSRASKGGGGGISGTRIEKKAGVYYVVIDTRETYSTTITDAEYVILPYGENAAASGLISSTVYLRTGYRSMPDETIDAYREGYFAIVYNSTPVITKEQFERLSSNYGYGNVQLMGESGEWTITGRVLSMTGANFSTTSTPVIEVIEAEPENNYKFLNFPAGIRFPTNVEMRIMASDILTDESGTAYAYLYRDGTLTPINSTYDEASGEIVFKTNYLGQFVISSDQIRGTTYPSYGTTPEIEARPPVEQSNPPTGSADAAMNATVALALFSMAAAFAVLSSRRKD